MLKKKNQKPINAKTLWEEKLRNNPPPQKKIPESWYFATWVEIFNSIRFILYFDSIK